MGQNNENQIFMLCIENKDGEDLERRKIYQVLLDSEASKEGYVRIRAIFEAWFCFLKERIHSLSVSDDALFGQM